MDVPNINFYVMTRAAVTFRLLLALIVGMGAPLWCCCAAEAATEVAAPSAVPACHHEAPPAGSHEQPGLPCDDDGDCDCASHIAQKRVSPDQPLTLSNLDGVSFLLDFQPVWLRLFDAAPDVFVFHETGPPPRPISSLFALHCMLTI